MDERTVDVSELNQRLVEEISSLQLKMIDILRENFRLKSEVETMKRSGGVWSTAGSGPMFSTARKHRHNNVARFPEQTTCYRNHKHHHGGHQPNRLVALWEDPLPGAYSSTASSWDYEGEMDDVNRRVEDMDRLIARLDAQTRDHENLYQEYIKLGTSLPVASAFRKQGESTITFANSATTRVPIRQLEAPVEAPTGITSHHEIRSNSPPQSTSTITFANSTTTRAPTRQLEAPVEAPPGVASHYEIRSNSPPQSTTPKVNSGQRTPQNVLPIPPASIHAPLEGALPVSSKGRLRRGSTMGMVVPDEPHARIGYSDASSEAGKSIAEEF